VAAGAGVAVGLVGAGSAAERAGIRRGDRVLAVAGRSVHDAGEARALIEAHAAPVLALLVERRDGSRGYAVLVAGGARDMRTVGNATAGLRGPI
jgi:S1-C subfamily serine protease